MLRPLRPAAARRAAPAPRQRARALPRAAARRGASGSKRVGGGWAGRARRPLGDDGHGLAPRLGWRSGRRWPRVFQQAGIRPRPGPARTGFPVVRRQGNIILRSEEEAPGGKAQAGRSRGGCTSGFPGRTPAPSAGLHAGSCAAGSDVATAWGDQAGGFERVNQPIGTAWRRARLSGCFSTRRMSISTASRGLRSASIRRSRARRGRPGGRRAAPPCACRWPKC